MCPLSSGTGVRLRRNMQQVHGYYDSGLKTGKWGFKSDPNFKIVGYYNAGNKDSIWSYFLDNRLYIYKNYKTGETISYYPNNKIKSKGDSIENEFVFKEFFKNGKIKYEIATGDSISYSKEYDEKSNLIEYIIFKNRIPYEIIKTTYKDKSIVYDGNLNKGTGTLLIKIRNNNKDEFYIYEKIELTNLKPNGKYEKYSSNNNIIEKGYYKDGFMIDKWQKYDINTNKLEKELFYNLKDSITRDTLEEIGYQPSGILYISGDMPKFQGESYDEFRTFITKNLKYPEEAISQSIQGKVYVQIIVDTDGKVINSKIVKSVHKLLDDEVLRVVNSSPYWRPGIQRGTAVKVAFTFPVVFSFN